MNKSRTVTTMVCQVMYEGPHLDQRVREIRSRKLTGDLHVRFSQGSVQCLTWQQTHSKRIEEESIRIR